MLELLVFHRGQTLLKEKLLHSLSIGSGPDCDLHLVEDVAPFHARIEVTAEVVILIEQEGPIYVNGEQVIGSAKLDEGDLFDIGTYRFQLIEPQTLAGDKTLTASISSTNTAESGKIPTLHILKPITATYRQVRMILGRHQGCDLTLKHPQVSSRHAEIFLANGTYYIRDLHSKNGTFINDFRITERELPAHGTLRLGRQTLSYQIENLHSEIAIKIEGVVLPGSHPQAPERLLVGNAPAFQEMMKLLAKIAPTDDTVLLLGETGTGKDLLAHYLHDHNKKRRDNPFVIVNAASIPSSMADSQLFGHVRGAFTGAVSDHTGYFQEADGGCLFLDEIAELSTDSQARLLRVIEDGIIRPLGASRDTVVNVRALFATNRDLEQARFEGKFREDLFQRFDWIVEVPPLRERAEDIPMLAQYSLSQLAPEPMQVSPEVALLLQQQDWPGNIRALNRAMRKAITNAVSRGGSVLATQDFDFLSSASPLKELPAAQLRKLKRQSLPELLERHQGNISQISQEIGISRLTIRRWLQADGIDVDSFRKMMPRTS